MAPNGGRYWRYNYRFNGKQKTLALGVYPDVTLPPLPREELLALKRTVAELGAIGRNLNQIARAANQGERVDGRGPPDVQLMLRVCGALRDHVKALLLANLRSWQEGHANSGEHHSERRGQ